MKQSALVLFGLLLCVLACGPFGSSTKDDTLSIDDLQHQYKKSWQDTKAKYDGKEVKIIGSVTSSSVFEDSAMIHIASQTDSELSGVADVTCVVDKAGLAAFGKIREKQAIKVQGTLTVTDSEMELKPCKWVSLTE